MRYPYVTKTLVLLIFFSNFLFSQTKQEIDKSLNTENKGWNAQKNIDFLNSIYQSSLKIGYEAGICKSLFKISNWYMQRGEYKNAIPYLEKLENLSIKNSENYKYKVRALQSKAFAFTNLGFYNDANTAIDRSLLESEQLKKDDGNFAKGNGYDLKSALYIELKKPEDSVLFYLKKSLAYYLKVKDKIKRKEGTIKAYINISTSFLEKKQIDSALFYSYKVLSMKNIGVESESYVLQTIGSAHIQGNHLDSALIYNKKSEKILQITKDPFALKACYQNLSEIYDKLNNKDSALIYSKKYGNLVDSLSLEDKKDAGIASQNIKEDVQTESQKKQYSLYWIIGGVIVLLSLTLLFSWNLLKNYLGEKKTSLKKKKIIEEKEIELEELKGKVNDSFKEVIELAKTNDPSFLGKFIEVYPEFCNKLLQICPDLLNSELSFCAYLKLNFSTKEIAEYIFVAPKSVQNRKNRIRKRLNIPSEEDLYIWISKI